MTTKHSEATARECVKTSVSSGNPDREDPGLRLIAYNFDHNNFNLDHYTVILQIFGALKFR